MDTPNFDKTINYLKAIRRQGLLSKQGNIELKEFEKIKEKIKYLDK